MCVVGTAVLQTVPSADGHKCREGPQEILTSSSKQVHNSSLLPTKCITAGPPAPPSTGSTPPGPDDTPGPMCQVRPQRVLPAPPCKQHSHAPQSRRTSTHPKQPPGKAPPVDGCSQHTHDECVPVAGQDRSWSRSVTLSSQAHTNGPTCQAPASTQHTRPAPVNGTTQHWNDAQHCRDPTARPCKQSRLLQARQLSDPRPQLLRNSSHPRYRNIDMWQQACQPEQKPKQAPTEASCRNNYNMCTAQCPAGTRSKMWAAAASPLQTQHLTWQAGRQ